MARRPALTEDERKAILDDIRTTGGSPDGSVRKIAARHDVSTATVRRIAADSDIDEPWSRDNTKNATRARVVDLASERAKLAERFAAESNAALDKLHAPYRVFAFGGMDNRFSDEYLDAPPASEFKAYMTAAGIAFDKHLAAVKHDEGTGGAEEAKSMLLGVADGLRTLYQASGMGGEEPSEPAPS